MSKFDSATYYKKRYEEDPTFRHKMIETVKKYQQRKRRELIIKLYGRFVDKCEACAKPLKLPKNSKGIIHGNLALHHISREAYGKEKEQNTAILCQNCHHHADLLRHYFGDIEKRKLLEILAMLTHEESTTKIKKFAEDSLDRKANPVWL